MNWGPYRNQPEARACVGAFADEIFKQHFGVIWSADDDAQWLRPPIYDHEGFGLTLLARFDGVQPPAPPKLHPPDGGRRAVAACPGSHLGRAMLRARLHPLARFVPGALVTSTFYAERVGISGDDSQLTSIIDQQRELSPL